MLVRAKNARCLGKDTHTFDNGDTVYRALFNNDLGDMLRVQFADKALSLWEGLELYDKRYELHMEARTSGYKTFIDLIDISESK